MTIKPSKNQVILFASLCVLISVLCASGCDWTGKWDTDFGQMTLQQSGNTITGSYAHNGGLIQATVSGNKLAGNWTENTGKNGDFEFTTANDCQSFTGNWRCGTTGGWSGEWNGNRRVAPTASLKQFTTVQAKPILSGAIKNKSTNLISSKASLLAKALESFAICLGGSHDDSLGSIQQTPDGGYVVAGDTMSNDGDVSGNHCGNIGYDEAWVVKLTMFGAIQWQKCLGGSHEDRADSIQQTTDGGYIIAGVTDSNDGDVSGYHGGYDAWVAKLSSSGAVQWQKCLGGSQIDFGGTIQQTTDGGYIVVGDTMSNDGDVHGNHGFDDAWVVKLSSSGAIQWQKCLGGSDNDSAYDIQQTPDGGYVVAGLTWSNDGDVHGNHGFNDAWVVKLSPSGAMQWQKCLGGSQLDLAKIIQQTTDRGYIVVGDTMSNDGDVRGNHGGLDAWVIKLSSSGAMQWQKCLGGSQLDLAKIIQPTTDGGYVVAGGSNSTDGDVKGNHGDFDAWVVKLSSSGAIQWQKSMGGGYGDSARGIQQTHDGGYIIAGITDSNDGDVSGNHGGCDAWVVKIPPQSYKWYNPTASDLMAANKVIGGLPKNLLCYNSPNPQPPSKLNDSVSIDLPLSS